MDPPVCYCFGVSEEKIRKTIKKHRLNTVREVTERCRAGGGCHTCWLEIEEILHDIYGDAGGPPRD